MTKSFLKITLSLTLARCDEITGVSNPHIKAAATLPPSSFARITPPEMASDILYINEKFLEKANYNLCLGDNLYVASFHERLILGPIEFDEVSGKAKFSKRAITLPSSQFVDFVRVV